MAVLKPRIKQMLVSAERIEKHVAAKQEMKTAEEEVPNSIDDPAERAKSLFQQKLQALLSVADGKAFLCLLRGCAVSLFRIECPSVASRPYVYCRQTVYLTAVDMPFVATMFPPPPLYFL